jgi:hypothetical protein
MLEQCLHSPMRFHGVELDQLNAGTDTFTYILYNDAAELESKVKTTRLNKP